MENMQAKIESDCQKLADVHLKLGRLPPQPSTSREGVPRAADERVMQIMAQRCCEDPYVGSVKSIGGGEGSSGVYIISVWHGDTNSEPLFVFKPLDEEPGQKYCRKGQEQGTSASGMAGVQQYSVESAPMVNRHTTLGQLQSDQFRYNGEQPVPKMGLITEFIASKGTIQKFIMSLEDRKKAATATVNAAQGKLIEDRINQANEERKKASRPPLTFEEARDIKSHIENTKNENGEDREIPVGGFAAIRERIEKQVEEKYANQDQERTELGIDPKVLASTQAFWNKCTSASVQTMSLSGLLTGNADQNVGNAVIRETGNAKTPYEIVEIDLAEGYPTNWPENGYNPPVVFHTPALQQPLEPAVKQKLSDYNVDVEIARVNTMRKEKRDASFN